VSGWIEPVGDADALRHRLHELLGVSEGRPGHVVGVGALRRRWSRG